MSDSTGNPAIVQIFGSTPEALVKYIDYVSEISDAPFLIDSTAADARIAGSSHVTEIGLSERTIYNSINLMTLYFLHIFPLIKSSDNQTMESCKTCCDIRSFLICPATFSLSSVYPSPKLPLNFRLLSPTAFQGIP